MKKCYDKDGNEIPCNDVTGENAIEQAKNLATKVIKDTKPVIKKTASDVKKAIKKIWPFREGGSNSMIK